MELSVTSLISATAAVMTVTIAWRALIWVWLRPRQLEKLLRQQGLSGNSYKFLFGDVIDGFKMSNEARSKPMEFSNDIISRIDPLLHQTIRDHGKNSFTWFGPVPLVIITEPELVREVFARINDFLKPDFSLATLLIPGIATSNGEKWAKHRKLINPAFHMGKLKLMLPAFYTSCNEMISRLEKMVPETGSIELDIWPHLVNLSSDVIARAAFSSSYVEGREAFELIEEQTQAVFSGIKQSFIPGWRFVPTKANRRFNKINKEIRNILRGIIEKRRKEVEAGEATKDDLLGTLMESNFGEAQNHGMTIDDMIDECKLFYFAGQETTSALLSFTMILLGRHTDWQERARQEILQAFGMNKPDFNGLNHLKTVTMILYEVLRLYPPLPASWRKVGIDTKLGKLSLPAGVFLSLPMISSHHDPQHWGMDAQEFVPERFSEGISKATNGNTIYFPFAMGPRICIGQNFALMEAKLALVMILQRFSFELSSSYTHAPSTIINIRPQFGAHIILHRL